MFSLYKGYRPFPDCTIFFLIAMKWSSLPKDLH
jgi:hypothetical protein